MVGLGGLLTVPEVADIVATLRVLHDPGPSAPLPRLLTGPRWRIGPRDLVALGKRARYLAHEQRRSVAAGGTSGTRTAAQTTARGTRRTAWRTAADDDPLAKAITDLTADPGSLVEALDDLGDPAGYSPAGHSRLAALAAELRELRSRVARPLPDLVGEVERALGLDIEVAARPGRDMASARADLDAFADAAAAFAGDQEEPTLGAFLAYLTAAEDEEFGLESGRVGDGDTVTLATVHASKGLQWAAVVQWPGLAVPEGAGVPGQAQVREPLDREREADPVRVAGRCRMTWAASAQPGRRGTRILRRRLRRAGPWRGAPAGLRGHDPGRVLATLGTGYAWRVRRRCPRRSAPRCSWRRCGPRAKQVVRAPWRTGPPHPRRGGRPRTPALAEPPSATWPTSSRRADSWRRSGKPPTWYLRPWTLVVLDLPRTKR